MGASTIVTIPQGNISMPQIKESIKKHLPVLGLVSLSGQGKNLPKTGLNYEIAIVLDVGSNEFESGKETRSLYITCYHSKPFIVISMGAWGSSKKIAKMLCNQFGGYADFCDTDDIEMDYAVSQVQCRHYLQTKNNKDVQETI